MAELEIHDLCVEVESKKILNSFSLLVKPGETHAIMGPNGTGKSTLAYTLMGHPKYKITRGSIKFDDVDIRHLSVEKRSQLGLFLAFQYPVSIPGVSVANFLRTAVNAHRKSTNPEDKGITIPEFRKTMLEKMALLKIPTEMGGRYLNEGFSGGEKKRIEILQMAMLKPRIALLDETDSGLDIDALRIVAEGINALRTKELGIIVITHYQRMLNYLQPDIVHVMFDGRIVKTGGPDLAMKLEAEGYDWIKLENL